MDRNDGGTLRQIYRRTLRGVPKKWLRVRSNGLMQRKAMAS